MNCEGHEHLCQGYEHGCECIGCRVMHLVENESAETCPGFINEQITSVLAAMIAAAPQETHIAMIERTRRQLYNELVPPPVRNEQADNLRDMPTANERPV